ncbi:MAG: hypothetical protein Q8M07_20615, partial [Prosthecobacter sp.]|nr:hypothetical protein [Prosthecobacter sp.]
ASNQEVTRFFASHGIEVTHVRREGELRHLRVLGQPLSLPMPASADECLRLVRECLTAQASAGTDHPSSLSLSTDETGGIKRRTSERDDGASAEAPEGTSLLAHLKV